MGFEYRFIETLVAGISIKDGKIQHQALSIGCQVYLMSILDISCAFDDDICTGFKHTEYFVAR